MKKNVLISGFNNKLGIALAKGFKASGAYVYGLDRKEDYEGVCDRAFRFDLNQFASVAEYRIRFSQIFGEVIPNLDTLVFFPPPHITGQLQDIQLDDWHLALNEYVSGPMLLCKLFLSRLEKTKGSIIFIGSNRRADFTEGTLASLTGEYGSIGLMKALSLGFKKRVKVLSVSVGKDFNSETEIMAEYYKQIADMSVFISISKLGSVNGQIITMVPDIIK